MSNKPEILFRFGKFSIIVDVKTAERLNMKIKARKQRNKKLGKKVRAKLKTL